MKKITTMLLGFLVLCIAVAPVALADSSLQESLIVVNGTQFHDTFAGPGINSGGFNGTTGLGTITITFDPGAAGTYSVGGYFDIQAGVPFYNEFGAVSGTAATGQSYQIDDPLNGTIYPNTQNNTLDNTNYIPAGASNYLGGCAPLQAGCNGDVSMAMGFNFNLSSNQQEVITLTLSNTQPTSGFFLEQVHPVDPNNPTENDIFFTGSAVAQNVVVGAPEPSSFLLLGLGLLGCAFIALRKKISAPQAA